LAGGFGSTAGVAVAVGLSLAFNEVDNAVDASIRNADQGVTATVGGVEVVAQSSGKKLFDIDLTGALTADNLNDAAEEDLDDSDTSGINEASLDLASDNAVLKALREALAQQGLLLALEDSVTSASMFASDQDDRVNLREGTTVKIAFGYDEAKGDFGRVYRYIGSDDNNVDLGSQNYNDTTRWVRLEKIKLTTIEKDQRWALAAPDGATYLLVRNGNKIGVSRNTINAVSAAASLAAGIGGTAGVAVAGAGAVAQNVILSKVNAYGVNSHIVSNLDVDLNATSFSNISAAVIAPSVAIGGSGNVGVGVAVGIAIARNMIGWTPLALEETPAQVRAYLIDSSVDADGNLVQTATSSQSIQSIVFAGAVGIGAAGTVGVSVAGSGAISENKIAVDAKSFIDGSLGSGISADRVTLTARDQSSIDAITGAASLSVAFGGTVGVAVSVGVSAARNWISSDVVAYVKDVGNKVQSTVGDIKLLADSQSRIQSISAAASIAAGFGGAVGVSVAGAGGASTNVILTNTEAFLDNSTLQSAGALSVEANNSASIAALVVAASGSVAIGGTVGVGASIGAATASNFIGEDELGFRTGSSVPSLLQGLECLGYDQPDHSSSQ
jgi:hypothetical protein